MERRKTHYHLLFILPSKGHIQYQGYQEETAVQALVTLWIQ